MNKNSAVIHIASLYNIDREVAHELLFGDGLSGLIDWRYRYDILVNKIKVDNELKRFFAAIGVERA